MASCFESVVLILVNWLSVIIKGDETSNYWLLIIIAEATFCCSKSVSEHCPSSAMAETKTLIAMSARGNAKGVKMAL